MEAAGPLFYSFSDFELVLIAAFANHIANANIVLDGRRRICVVLVDGTSARSTIEFFVGMNHDVAMPVLRWGVWRILLLDEIVFLHFLTLHYLLFSVAIISQIVASNKKKSPKSTNNRRLWRLRVALAEGFEPSDSLPSSVFWTDFINHSNKQADGAEGEIRTHMPRFPRRQLSKLLPYR